VLSELAGLMLMASIGAAFEKVQWMLMANEGDGRSPGVGFLVYLSLHIGTGLLGLLKIIFGVRATGLSSRAWGAIRLVSMITVPLLNVLIMGTSQNLTRRYVS
jgi:hypothetical protein